MKPRERIINALLREPVDRPPVAGFCTAINRTMMEWAGEDFATAYESPERYAKLAAAPWEVYGIENFKMPFDMTVEPELFGAEIDLGDALILPQARRHVFESAADCIIPIGWQDKGRAPFMREVCRLLKTRYGDELAIAHLCDGPFTLANMIFGFNNRSMWMIADSESYARAAS